MYVLNIREITPGTVFIEDCHNTVFECVKFAPRESDRAPGIIAKAVGRQLDWANSLPYGERVTFSFDENGDYQAQGSQPLIILKDEEYTPYSAIERLVSETDDD